MKKLKKIDSSIWCFGGAAAAVYLVMLLFNFLTPYIADDYAYMASFYTQAYLKNVRDVVLSMYRHAYVMNGRLVSHGLDSLFMLLPKAVFNIANAGVFTGLMYLIYRAANFGRGRSAGLFLGISAAFWLVCPAFGQVVLWQTGAVNYLWALFFMLGFTAPFIYMFVHGRQLINNVWLRAAFTLGSFLFGAYTEIASLIGILVSCALVLLGAVLKREKPLSWLLAPIAAAAAGYAFMLLMPAESIAKSAAPDLAVLLKNFAYAVKMLKERLLWPVAVWAALFMICALRCPNLERLTLSLTFAVSSVAGDVMLTAASYYEDRCLYVTAALIVLASAVLIPSLTELSRGALTGALLGVVAVLAAFSLVAGGYDIWRCHVTIKTREANIAAAVERGETTITVPCTSPETKYSAFWGLADLNTETAETWPNNYIATYHGLKTILGYR